jgi:pilus assembly protein Flp/PilA
MVSGAISSHQRRQAGVSGMLSAVVSFMKADDGATSIEYALIAAFIGIVIVTAVTNIGLDLSNVFNNVIAGF